MIRQWGLILDSSLPTFIYEVSMHICHMMHLMLPLFWLTHNLPSHMPQSHKCNDSSGNLNPDITQTFIGKLYHWPIRVILYFLENKLYEKLLEMFKLIWLINSILIMPSSTIKCTWKHALLKINFSFYRKCNETSEKNNRKHFLQPNRR